MAGILNEVHSRMSKATETKRSTNGRRTRLYWVGDAYYQLNDLVSAEKIYKEFILRAPQSPLVPYALEALASTLSAQGPTRDGEAIIALNQSELRSRDLGNKELAEQIDVELGKVYYNQRDFAKAAATWNRLWSSRLSPSCAVKRCTAKAMRSRARSFTRKPFAGGKPCSDEPHQHLGPEALMRIGNTQAGLGQWAEAASTFNTLKTSYPGSEMGKEGAFQLVQCAFNQGNLNSAVNELLSFF